MGKISLNFVPSSSKFAIGSNYLEDEAINTQKKNTVINGWESLDCVLIYKID